MQIINAAKNTKIAKYVMWISVAIFATGTLVVVANVSERANLFGNIAALAGASILFVSYIIFRILKSQNGGDHE